MRILMFSIAWLALLTVLSRVVSGPLPSQETAGVSVRDLIGKLGKREIMRVDILRMEPSSLTRTRITPADLERGFEYRLTINNIQSTKYSEGLIEALSSISVVPITIKKADVRWGVVAYDKGDARIASLYVDGTGNYGVYNGVDVSFTGGLPVMQWLDNNFFRKMNSVLQCGCPDYNKFDPFKEWKK